MRTTIVEQSVGPQQGPVERLGRIQRALVILFALALLVTCLVGIRHATEPFDYAHAFVSADLATTARTFARIGVWKLHGIPVNNNPPIIAADAYTHWPPLLPILLSGCFRIFGSAEQVAHLLMLCVVLTTALMVYEIGRHWLGLAGGVLAGFFWLTMPVTVQFGHSVVQQPLMVLFVTAAVAAFLHGRLWMGGALLFLAALSSWESVLVAVGLLLAWRVEPSLKQIAVSACAGTGAATLLVVALYLFGSPGLAMDTLQAAKFYMGVSSSYSHVLLPAQINIGTREQIRRVLINNVLMLGPLGLGAALQLFFTRTSGRALIVGSLATPWLVWCVLMRNHVARHHFELTIAAPFVALALAWFATTSRRQEITGIVLAALALVQLSLLPSAKPSDGYDPAALIRYGEAIRQSTQPDAVVMAPLISAVPLYYSDRHIIRGIDNDSAVARELPEVQRQFPRSPIYVAVPPMLAPNFSGGQIMRSDQDAVIRRIADPLVH